MKGLVYVPTHRANLEGPKQKITTALKTVTHDMMRRVWESWSTGLACAVSQAVRMLNISEIGYEIRISLNFSFKFRGIILILFKIWPVQFH